MELRGEVMKGMEMKGIDLWLIRMEGGLGKLGEMEVEDLRKDKMDWEEMLVKGEGWGMVKEGKERGKKVCGIGSRVMGGIERGVGREGDLKEFEGWRNKFILGG